MSGAGGVVVGVPVDADVVGLPVDGPAGDVVGLLEPEPVTLGLVPVDDPSATVVPWVDSVFPVVVPAPAAANAAGDGQTCW